MTFRTRHVHWQHNGGRGACNVARAITYSLVQLIPQDQSKSTLTANRASRFPHASARTLLAFA
ncbi:hypothetical protein [Xanthomonas maliensis]|uniref:hypothetical protein n=1 Tax=Xanthomonas maliensis TaxID=1321368 RepID=UPI00039983C1|nr:hypothetical protein [Xanthomonas maliensis]KAB7765036.1 hypothetical protein CKY51_16240 [Xanthomonas maliensis]